MDLPSYAVPDGLPKPDLPGVPDRVVDAYFAYPAEPITMFDESPGDGSVLNAMYPMWDAGPPGVKTNRYWQTMNKAMNVDFQPTLVPQAEYDSKFAVMAAGGDLPDLMAAPLAMAGFPRLLEAKFTDLTDYVSGDKVADYPNLGQLTPASWRSCVFNGRIYAVPQSQEPMPSSMFLRLDLIEEHGLDPNPANFEEFRELCRGLTDVSRSRWAITSLSGVKRLVDSMLAIPNDWVERDGAFTSRLETEQYLESVAALATLVADESIHPDAIGAPTSQAKAWFENGTCAMHSDGFATWGANTYDDPDMMNRIAPLLPPGFSGGEGTSPITRPYYRLMLIPQTDESRVRALLSLLNYLNAPFGTSEYLLKDYGEEGVHFTKKGSDPILTPLGHTETALMLRYVGKPPAVNYNPGEPEITRKKHEYSMQLQEIMLEDPTLGLYSDTQLSKGAQIGAEINDMQQEVILGRASMDDLRTAVDRWRSSGGNAIREEFEQAFADAQDLD